MQKRKLSDRFIGLTHSVENLHSLAIKRTFIYTWLAFMS